MNTASHPAAAGTPSGGAFGSRVLFASLVTAAFAALAWADWCGLGGAAPAWWLLPVAVALALGGVVEMAGLFAARGIGLPQPPLAAAVIGMVLAAAAGGGVFGGRATESPAVALGWAAAAAVAGFVGLGTLEIARYRPQGAALERLAAGALVIVFLGLPLACIVGLRLIRREPSAAGPGGSAPADMLPLVTLVAVTKAGDIAAYLGGTLCGRHRMAATLSPGKTWEGAAASLTGSVATAWLLLEGMAGAAVAGPWGGWLVFGAGVGLAGMLGDLAESLLKRECGAKDSGRMLGGLGGCLDLIDSLLFAAPVAWVLWSVGRS